ncbi:MAG: hypothetical protein ABEI52_11645 [Halobacteriaceae archaeon]
MSAEDAKQIEAQRRRQAFHQNNLQGQSQQDGEAAEILRYLSNIDDLPIEQDDSVMGPLVSKLISTANLSAEQVKSNEWVFEYLLVLYLSLHPPKYGMHGDERAIAHDSREAKRPYLTSEERMQIEAFIQIDKMAVTRSEEMKLTEEATRNVSESVVHEEGESSSGGGILGRIRG